MKNGKVTFADFEKFMKFLGLWEEYKKECKKVGNTLKSLAKVRPEDYVYTAFTWLPTGKEDLWFNVDWMWRLYIRIKETEVK